MKLVSAALSDIGRKRSQNQDSLLVEPDLQLFIVADGMGGHLGGGTASSMVVSSAPGTLQSHANGGAFDPRVAIMDALASANRKIYERSSHDPELEGMGTTTTALWFVNGQAVIGHVGDSRCYCFRSRAAWQLTRDHSLVEEKLRAGLITREQVKTDLMKNVITRSVGFEPEVLVDVYAKPVQKLDLFLLCSDGVSGQMDEDEIRTAVDREIFQSGSTDEPATEERLKALSQYLIQRANDHGGEDNATVILVQVAEV